MANQDKDCVVVNYPLPGNDSGGRVFIYGLDRPGVDCTGALTDGRVMETNRVKIGRFPNPTKLQVIFFCCGYPNNCTTFQPLAQRLSNTLNLNGSKIGTGCDEKIICGVTCLPGYDTHHNNFKKEGYTFDEMAVSLQSACKMLLSTIKDHFSTHHNENVSINIQLTGIFHDLGCQVGAIAVNRSNRLEPNYYHKVVYLDVLPRAHPKSNIPRDKLNVVKSLKLILYKSLFAMCHAIQRYVSFWVAMPIELIGYSVLFLLCLLPVRFLDTKTFLLERPKEYTPRRIMYLQYPYYYLLRGYLSQGPELFWKTTMSDATLPEHVSTVGHHKGTPVLYMYGTKKNAMFHDTNAVAWLQHPDQRPSSVVQVDGAGHWLYRHKEDICYEAICQFLVTS